MSSLSEICTGEEIMQEICSSQCADSTYCCDYFKCSRQVSSNAHRRLQNIRCIQWTL